MATSAASAGTAVSGAKPPPRLHDLRHNYAGRRLALWRQEGKDVNALLPILAAQTCPSLQDRNVTPHVFRHTTALQLLEAGNDIGVVRDWLGHADIKTAGAYLEVSLRRKCQALENFPPPSRN